MSRFLRLVVVVNLVFSIGILNAQRGVNWADDGNSYYAIESNDIVQYELPALTKKVVLENSKLVPAGQKDALAVRSFSFSADKKKVLIYTNTKRVWRQDTRGDYWVLDIASGSLKQLGKGKPESSLMFAKISPDSKKAAYVSGHNIFVEDLATNKITALTTDGTDRLINGTFDWAYEEEFDCRDGFRWSPDSKNIAYWQIDARKIRNFLLINNTDSVYSFTVPVEYPKAGEDPSPCKVGVVNVASAKTKWMAVPGDPRQHYIPRMEWAANNTELVLEQLNRKQNEAKIFFCNAATGVAKPIYTETNNAWIDPNDGWEWLEGGKTFLWVSEKDGWRHLYKLDRNGKETLITNGKYDIISMQAIDEKGGYAYFMASPDNATQSYLYRIALTGSGQAELLSPAAQKGTHNYSISPDGQFATHTFSNIKNERASDWVRLPSHEAFKTNAAATTRRSGAGASGAPNVEMFQVTTDDNITLDGWMVKPKNFDSTKKYPVLFTVYAEPASATVKDVAGGGNNGLYAGDFAGDGYIYISLDGRGTPSPKGAAWRKAIYRNIGAVNIRDQAMGAKKIMQWPWVDTSRIAVSGWSGGGSTTLNLLFQYPEIYKTGIAIAPVANQLLYDNIYQERYMGLPKETMQDYVKGSPITHAKNLRGNLLVIHGTGDDNVHYQGTEMLINELVKHGKQFQMMSYPNRTHGIREGEGTYSHLQQLYTSFLREHCPGGGR
ncbi:S9 family peptidase [Segetibacter sp. 3557_3]|uniref:S9 family peptidase n=1 Tax=Segetibacter sp. 3557_3 TaxID=2547429 RepID=UPI001A9CF2C0|nr:S9 family peptidase [Segetibacter sp. 3557_3]